MYFNFFTLFPVGIETDTEETPRSKKSKKEKRSKEESLKTSIRKFNEIIIKRYVTMHCHCFIILESVSSCSC